MTNPLTRIRSIEDEAAHLSVLLVEGQDDQIIYEYFFDMCYPGWDAHFRIDAVEGKPHVLNGVGYREDWIGLVDRDDWSDEIFAAMLLNKPNLKGLPRYCIESYFCDPQELWRVLPDTLKNRVGNDPTRLSQPILDVLPDWVAHGAMWRVLRRIDAGNRHPKALDDQPVTDKAKIISLLRAWHTQINPDIVLTKYDEELKLGSSLPLDEQLHVYIHGKKFFRMVVLQTLDHLFSNPGKSTWLEEFRKWKIQPPPDLIPLIDEIVQHFLEPPAFS
jgi:hypothetical protein